MVRARFSLLVGTAMTLAASASPGLAQQSASPNEGAGAEDIIVTAQRREQALADIPQAISVVGAETLEKQQLTSFTEYARLIPGFSVTQENPGESRLILRGINTGSVGSTVSTYVDDSPFGSSGSLSNGGVLAGDFDTFDVARVEILKGPQGTLYGSNSLGGVLKYVTAEPSLERLSVRGQAGLEDTKSGGMGYLGNAVANLPLSETVAVRASGFYRKAGGYVDAVGRAGNDVNRYDSYGGRASVLFKPNDAFSARLFALAQNIDVDSPSSFEASPLTLRPVNALNGAAQGKYRTRYERYPERNDVDYRLYSGTLSYDFGPANITSVTSYSKQNQAQFTDGTTNALRATFNALYAPTAPNTVSFGIDQTIDVKKFTQEVRLASADSDTFEWLVGGYYTDEDTALLQNFQPYTLATQALIPTALTFGGAQLPYLVRANIDATYKEYAAFGSATVHFGERFDITAGGRYSHNKQSSTQAIYQLGTNNVTNGTSGEGVFTWSVAPRFELSDRASLYGRVAKGYRPGGPNFIPIGAPANFPGEFDADTLISYEAGLRAETEDHVFAVDASLYYIDWKDILITTTITTSVGPANINANGQKARSKGAELTATVRPTRGLSLVGNLSYTDAKLRDDTVPASGGTNGPGGLAGDRLPYTPKFAANLSADYEWFLSDDANAFVGGNLQRTGEQTAGFSAAYRAAFGRRIQIDGYTTVDLRAGVDFKGFTVNAYVKNLTNAYGVTNAGGYPFAVPTALGGTNTPFLRVSTVRPRTIGATVGFSF